MSAKLRLVHNAKNVGILRENSSKSGTFRQKRPCRAVPLTPELLTLAAISERDASEMFGMVPQVLAAALQRDMGYAFLDGGLLVGALGVLPIFRGRGVGWMMVSGLARPRHLAFMTRHARALFDRLAEREAYRRIEIQVRADRPWRESFAARLGMNEALGPMRCWDLQGRDYWQYARVTPWPG